MKDREQRQNSFAVSDDVKREQRLRRLNKTGEPYRRITNKANEPQSELRQTWTLKHRYTDTLRATFLQKTYLPPV